MTTVIFACVHNAGRSQMAAAFFNAMVNTGLARAISAGTRPAGRIHPEVAAAMQEVGLDLSGAVPRQLTRELALQAALLITLGCGEECPAVPDIKRDDWRVPDPKGLPMSEVRQIRDELRERVRTLLTAHGWQR